MESQSTFVPYLSDPSFLDDTAGERAAAAAEQRATAERTAAAKRRAAARIRALETDDDENPEADFGDKTKAIDTAAADAPPAPTATRGAVASWTKALILTAAIVVIGAFAWYAAERFVGPTQWIVKFSCVAWLMGMGTATAMLHAARTGPAAKILAALAAVLAIVLGKALIICHPELPPQLAHFTNAPELARTFAQLAFKPLDGLFAALTIMGLAARFILSGRDE
jgi:hypothetical protein